MEQKMQLSHNTSWSCEAYSVKTTARKFPLGQNFPICVKTNLKWALLKNLSIDPPLYGKVSRYRFHWQMLGRKSHITVKKLFWGMGSERFVSHR